MNKKIFGGIATLAIAAAVALNVTLSNHKQNQASLLVLTSTDALADGEGGGTIGPIGTNWKTQSFLCSQQVEVGIPPFVVVKTTYYYHDGCGSGSGWCLSPAGC